MKYRTTFTTKAEVVHPQSKEFKAIASTLQESYGFDLKPQMDLLYARSCLVSAGTSVGVNDNDDIFTREEAWAARHTPVLKPFNWQHQDKDILGVMYTVQACDLDGNVLDISDDTPPDCDFDLWVEAAIFRLIHESRAAEIEARSKAGTLFVSMEAWFDDYSYGLCDPDTGDLGKIVARQQNTTFLDRHLRAGGGTGVYRDPESDQDMRIGRVLRAITFGGCGFVDRPANKRSKIDTVESMNSSAERDTESQIEILLQKVEVLEAQHTQQQAEELVMNHTQGNQGSDPEVIGAAIGAELDKRDKAEAVERERTDLVARAEAAETAKDELQAKVDELSQAQDAKDVEVEALQNQLKEYDDAVEGLVQEQSTASAPAEIAAIDGVTDGDSAWNAKIAWIQKSMASLRDRAARADELEAELAKAEAVVREQEVRSLFGDLMSDEAVETFVSHASSLDEDEYSRWRDEKELMLLELSQAKKELPEAFKKKGKDDDDKDDKKDKGKANIFEGLLRDRRAEAYPETPTDMGDMINPPGGEGVESGVSADQLRTPRNKIAGSTAGNDPVEELENAQAEDGIQLAGAQASDDGEGENPFRTLAGLVTNTHEEEDDEVQDRPGFDPVQ
jgi:hypothetical protein